ncbi:MAG: SpoIIE family protein phosphatase [Chloroherpetonaceae bacterium]|nr:SpoIIE family protein phosphatase [Chloroherpetonaceae bacterium]
MRSVNLFEETRLEALLIAHRSDSAQETLHAVVEAVQHFQPEGEQYDDITAVCLKAK